MFNILRKIYWTILFPHFWSDFYETWACVKRNLACLRVWERTDLFISQKLTSYRIARAVTLLTIPARATPRRHLLNNPNDLKSNLLFILKKTWLQKLAINVMKRNLFKTRIKTPTQKIIINLLVSHVNFHQLWRTRTFKTCSKCNTKLPSTNFNKNKQRKDGLYTFCKNCEHNQRRKLARTQTPTHLKTCKNATKPTLIHPKGNIVKIVQENWSIIGPLSVTFPNLN